MLSLQMITQARGRVAPVARCTPVLDIEIPGRRVALKLENLQRTGAFKIRGATNCIALMDAEERARGVIAASAGNHAQGVAAAALAAGVEATIVMPRNTPIFKVDRTRTLGAHVILEGDDFDQANAHARELCAEKGLVFVHPFADERVIAGQGTIGLELLEQVPDMTSVIVPVGGGGLIAGIGCAIKESAPKIKVFGVQSALAPAMACSFEAGHATPAPVSPTIADGIAVGRPEELNCQLLRRYVDGVVTVTDAQIATAMLRFIEDEKLVVEGAGAATRPALEAFGDVAGDRPVLVLSGGNVDITTLGAVIDRGLAEAGRSVRLLVDLPDIPGALAGLAAAVSESRANIIEILHNRLTGELELGKAEVEMVLSTRGPDHVAEILKSLRAKGYNARRHEHPRAPEDC